MEVSYKPEGYSTVSPYLVVMLADGGEGWQPMPAHVHIYVKEVDATYKHAIAADAISVQGPIKKDDEDKRGGVKDERGTT